MAKTSVFTRGDQKQSDAVFELTARPWIQLMEQHHAPPY